jgi:hypothetical protein
VISTLKGSPLWAVVVVVLAVIGSVTYLASQSILTGSDVLSIIILILTGVVGITTAHVAGQSAIQAGVSTVPAPPPVSVITERSAPNAGPTI